MHVHMFLQAAVCAATPELLEVRRRGELLGVGGASVTLGFEVITGHEFSAFTAEVHSPYI